MATPLLGKVATAAWGENRVRVVQRTERHPAKVEITGSNPVSNAITEGESARDAEPVSKTGRPLQGLVFESPAFLIFQCAAGARRIARWSSTP